MEDTKLWLFAQVVIEGNSKRENRFIFFSGAENARLFSQGTTLLDHLTSKEVTKFLIAGVLIMVGLAFIIKAVCIANSFLIPEFYSIKRDR
jgi:hypothetical protein